MTDTLVFATHNQDKIKEAKEILTGFKILSLSDVGVSSLPEETGDSFLENATIKAEAVANKISLPVFADDSGLCIDALNGFPGIYSARYMEEAGWKAKNLKILSLLEKEKDRDASFVCSIVYIDKTDNLSFSCTASVDGKIIEQKDFKEGGFGYDPIFYNEEIKMTFAEAEGEIKNKVSHRGKALRELARFLKKEH